MPETPAPEPSTVESSVEATAKSSVKATGKSSTEPSTAEPYEARIRTARAADAETLAMIDRLVWSPVHAVMPQPQPPYDPFFDERHQPREYLVAEYGERLVGYVRVARPTELASNAHVRQIQGLAVLDGERGRGLARTLVRAAVAEARRLGARRLTLRVLGHNAAARALYESEGFVVEGILPEEFLLAGEYVDDVLMGLRL